MPGDRSPDLPVEPTPRGTPPAGGPPSGAPPLVARIAAFAAILVAGVCGGLIGYGFTDLQCDGSCSTQEGIGALIGAIAAAVGTAIIAVLTLRAMGEWAAGGKRRD